MRRQRFRIPDFAFGLASLNFSVLQLWGLGGPKKVRQSQEITTTKRGGEKGQGSAVFWSQLGGVPLALKSESSGREPPKICKFPNFREP